MKGGTALQITEENLVEQLRCGNEDALEYVVRQYGGMLKAVISRILYDAPQDAEECLYDTLMKIWLHSGSFDGSGSFSGWAAAVAKYTALDRLRVLKRLQPAADIDSIAVAVPAGLTGDALFDEFFAELISCLSAEDQAIFTRIFWYGDSMDETAERFGKPKSVLYNRISRGKQRIIRQHPDYFKQKGRKKHE